MRNFANSRPLANFREKTHNPRSMLRPFACRRGSMKFGLLYEMETPRPWHERSEYNTYWEALAQIELADRIGMDYVWEVEHHFLEEYSHSSAPEVFYGAVSQRTKNIRIAHGVRLLPFNFNNPIKVAEQAAVLDYHEQRSGGSGNWPLHDRTGARRL